MTASDTASLPGKEPLSLPQAKANKPIKPGENRINLQATGRHRSTLLVPRGHGRFLASLKLLYCRCPPSTEPSPPPPHPPSPPRPPHCPDTPPHRLSPPCWSQGKPPPFIWTEPDAKGSDHLVTRCLEGRWAAPGSLCPLDDLFPSQSPRGRGHCC